MAKAKKVKKTNTKKKGTPKKTSKKPKVCEFC